MSWMFFHSSQYLTVDMVYGFSTHSWLFFVVLLGLLLSGGGTLRGWWKFVFLLMFSMHNTVETKFLLLISCAWLMVTASLVDARGLDNQCCLLACNEFKQCWSIRCSEIRVDKRNWSKTVSIAWIIISLHSISSLHCLPVMLEGEQCQEDNAVERTSIVQASQSKLRLMSYQESIAIFSSLIKIPETLHFDESVHNCD